MSEKKSFWKTLPGIISQIVAVITAIAALIGVIKSLLPEKATVPLVTGFSHMEAVQRLESEGLKSIRPPIEERTAEKDSGTVLRQTPSAGKEVSKDEVIELVIAIPLAKVTVPPLINLSRAEAVKELESLGLLGEVSGKEITGSRKHETVLDQTPSPGKKLTGGKAVKLVIAYHPDTLLTNAKKWNPMTIHSGKTCIELFDKNNFKWPVIRDLDEYLLETYIRGGKFYVKVKSKKDNVYATMLPAMDPVENFYLSVKTRFVDGPAINESQVRFGLAFGEFASDDKDFYAFRISNENFSQLSHDTGNGLESRFGLYHSGIRFDSTETLTAIVRDSVLYFYAGKASKEAFIESWEIENGQESGDEKRKKRNVGLIVTIEKKGKTAEIEFDDFELRKSPD